LPTIGTIHPNAFKKINKILVNEKEYINLPSSFIAFIAGLMDGDGYIQITKTSKGFITMKLVISLHLDDLSTLEYIHSTLKLGKITIYKDNKSPTCKLTINRTHLQRILFPLFLYHNIFFLTKTRLNQFNLALYILENNIKEFDQISSINSVRYIMPKTPEEYIKLSFFKN